MNLELADAMGEADFGFCSALQCVFGNLFFEYDYIDYTAGDFGLADAMGIARLRHSARGTRMKGF